MAMTTPSIAAERAAASLTPLLLLLEPPEKSLDVLAVLRVKLVVPVERPVSRPVRRALLEPVTVATTAWRAYGRETEVTPRELESEGDTVIQPSLETVPQP